MPMALPSLSQSSSIWSPSTTLPSHHLFPPSFFLSLSPSIPPSLDPISQEKIHWNSLKTDFDQLREEGRRLYDDKGKNTRYLEVAKKRMFMVQNNKNRLRQELLELQNAEEEEETQEDVATYEIEIQECEERIKALGQEQGEREEALKVAKAEVKECDRKILETEAGVDEVTRRMENLRVGSNWNML